MPLGENRTDLNTADENYRLGTPVTTPVVFGVAVTEPLNVGNPVPTNGHERNAVGWSPAPAHFGNNINLSSGN